MAVRFRSIQVLVWMTLASFTVAKLDAQSRLRASALASEVAAPEVAVAARADTRHSVDTATPQDTAFFEGFEITQAMRDSIVALARAQVGRPYRFGGNSPRQGFDCSGLVKFVLGQLHIALPRLAAQQALVGEPVGREELRPGDLVSFGEGRTISHIGIYVGDGRFVHASSVAKRVIVSRLDRKTSRLIRPLQGARRLYALAAAPRAS